MASVTGYKNWLNKEVRLGKKSYLSAIYYNNKFAANILVDKNVVRTYHTAPWPAKRC